MESGDKTNDQDKRKSIVVLSGKGGVGKSTVASLLAIALWQRGKRVGLLDVDLCGPSIPKLFNVENSSIRQSARGWTPVYPAKDDDSLGLVSMGFLLADRNESVVWRGPKKTSMIKSFADDIDWGHIDYLVIDTPPGTSDEHIALLEALVSKRSGGGAILVTTPQMVAVNDVRRQVSFCRKARLPMLGLVENMSGFECPNCHECSNMFSSGGGEQLAQLAAIPFLGRLPLNSGVAADADSGSLMHCKFLAESRAFREIVDQAINSD